MSSPLRVVHYVNQFFGGIGGEDQANVGVSVKAGAVGPGRALEAGRGTLVAYLLVTAGAALRVAGPLIGGALEWHLVGVAGVTWAAGYLVFVASYAPILLRPRAPGPARC